MELLSPRRVRRRRQRDPVSGRRRRRRSIAGRRANGGHVTGAAPLPWCDACATDVAGTAGVATRPTWSCRPTRRCRWATAPTSATSWRRWAGAAAASGGQGGRCAWPGAWLSTHRRRHGAETHVRTRAGALQGGAARQRQLWRHAAAAAALDALLHRHHHVRRRLHHPRQHKVNQGAGWGAAPFLRPPRHQESVQRVRFGRGCGA